MPVDTLDFGRFPIHVTHGAPGRNTTNRRYGASQDLRDVAETQPDDRPGSPHSTELDVVDMHVQRLALEVTSDEDACSSIDIVLSQGSDLAKATSETGRAI